MKTTNKLFTVAVLICIVAGLAITSSCLKSANVYSPKRPIQPVNGFYTSNSVDAANLVAYWPFNGNLTDSLSNTTGVSTLTSFAKGVEGQGLQGADSGYVVSDVPAAVQNLHSFTLTTWYNMPENTKGVVALVDIANDQSFWGNLDIFLENPPNATTGQLKVHLWNNGTSATGTDAWEGDYVINNAFNVWNQVAVTYNDTTSTVKVYFNGALVGTNTQAGFAPLNWVGVKKMAFGTLQFQTNPSLTGAVQYPGFGSYLVGEMDQVRIFNKVLTLNDIGAVYGLEKLGR